MHNFVAWYIGMYAATANDGVPKCNSTLQRLAGITLPELPAMFLLYSHVVFHLCQGCLRSRVSIRFVWLA